MRRGPGCSSSRWSSTRAQLLSDSRCSVCVSTPLHSPIGPSQGEAAQDVVPFPSVYFQLSVYCVFGSKVSLLLTYIARSIYHELLWAKAQLHLIAIDNSDVNPAEEVFPDGYPDSKACRPLTLKTAAFLCNFPCAITAMISPHYHAFSCDVYM